MAEPDSTTQVDLQGNKGKTTIRIWRRENHTLRQEVTENGTRRWSAETRRDNPYHDPYNHATPGGYYSRF